MIRFLRVLYDSMLLIIILVGLLNRVGLGFTGGEEYPTIQLFDYNITNRVGTTEFVDFNYELVIQGGSQDYTMVLEVTLYDDEDDILTVIRKVVTIKTGTHTIKNVKMIRAETARSLPIVGPAKYSALSLHFR